VFSEVAPAADQPVWQPPGAHPVQKRKISKFDSMAIIGGSAVGGGFLAVPDITAPLGILPSTAGLVATWLFLLLAGLAYVEAAGKLMVKGPSRPGQSSSREEGGGASVLCLSSECFGVRPASVLSALFLVQMMAIITANLLKTAELSTVFLPLLPFPVAVFLAAAAFGIVSFTTPSPILAAANTALTSCMCAGFAALFAVAAVVQPRPANLLAHAQWGRLLPQRGWVIPIFANTLRFGEAVPVVLGQLGPTRLHEARSAVVFGSMLPLLLAVGWSISSISLASLVAQGGVTTVDPVIALLSASPLLSVPMALIAIGAVGSTMIAVILACSQLLDDVFQSRRAPERLVASRLMVVVVPACFACLGSGSYTKLLAFSGAFPTMILYGVLPSLAALLLRLRESGPSFSFRAVPKVPGGKAVLVTLLSMACIMLSINAKLML